LNEQNLFCAIKDFDGLIGGNGGTQLHLESACPASTPALKETSKEAARGKSKRGVAGRVFVMLDHLGLGGMKPWPFT
jgi:hypothetical protein